MKKTEKLKRAVIKEELVKLTGDFKRAIVLNQMIYWSEKAHDFDRFISEEKERFEKFGIKEDNSELTNGWIYKKSEQLSSETMMNVQPKAMRTYLKYLVSMGWLSERSNPKIVMDKTLQYRVNILKIQIDLLKAGYSLEGYKIPAELIDEISKAVKENPKGEKENSTGEKETKTAEKEAHTGEKENSYNVTEIITEIPSKIKKEKDIPAQSAGDIAEIPELPNPPKKSEKKVSDPRVKEIHDFYLANHPLAENYFPQYPKERKIIKNLIANIDANGKSVGIISERLQNYFKSDFYQATGWALESFVKNFNAFTKVQKQKRAFKSNYERWEDGEL